MDNYNGIIYRIGAVAGPILILGILLIVIAFRKPMPQKKWEILFAVGVISVSLIFGGWYLYKSLNPVILCQSGYISEIRRYNKVPFTNAYIFLDDKNEKKTFYLDSFSKKKIMTKNFEENHEYQIFYEKDTKIIVRVED